MKFGVDPPVTTLEHIAIKISFLENTPMDAVSLMTTGNPVPLKWNSFCTNLTREYSALYVAICSGKWMVLSHMTITPGRLAFGNKFVLYAADPLAAGFPVLAMNKDESFGAAADGTIPGLYLKRTIR